jgi:glycosyltransferase involved in cell wall biosynthesis
VARLEAQIARQGLGQSVALLGHRKDVPALTKAADLYVSSSWSEGLGTSVLEALAARVPVVATEAGGVSEMVVDGETGLLTPNRNPEALAGAMLRSLRAPAAAQAMAERGRAHVEAHFTVERMVAGNIAVYEELLGS